MLTVVPSSHHRIFVHASEENNVNNIQVLGLMLGNYVVPDMSVLKTQDCESLLSVSSVSYVSSVCM